MQEGESRQEGTGREDGARLRLKRTDREDGPRQSGTDGADQAVRREGEEAVRATKIQLENLDKKIDVSHKWLDRKVDRERDCLDRKVDWKHDWLDRKIDRTRK